MEISQGNTSFRGQCIESPNRKYLGIFQDGYVKIVGDKKLWVSGAACLVENDNLIWFREFERPWNLALSDNGIAIIIHSKYRDSSGTKKPVPGKDLGGQINIIDKIGSDLITQFFTSNLLACTISPDGKLVVVATLSPDDSIYCFETDKKQMLWKYKNHSHRPVLRLSIDNDTIFVYTGGSTAASKEEYQLTFNGTLKLKDTNLFQSVNELNSLPFEDGLNLLLTAIKSNERTIMLKALSRLQSVLYDKKSIKHYQNIIQNLASLLSSSDEETFDLLWKNLRVVMRKEPQLLQLIIPSILERVKKINPDYKEVSMFYLNELCSINPAWIKGEIPEITNIRDITESVNTRLKARSLLTSYEEAVKKQSGEIKTYEFPNSQNQLQINIVGTIKNKTKDHILNFSNRDLVARIGWTKPGKLARFDENQKTKWSISIPGRIRNIKSDSIGTVATVSDFIKNQNVTSIKTSESEQEGQFTSSFFVIDNDGKIVKTVSSIDGFITLVGISENKILIWNTLTLNIVCYDREEGSVLWSKSFKDLIGNKYGLRIIHYYSRFDKILTVHIFNKQKKPVIPSIISVIDGNGKILQTFESDGFPNPEELERFKIKADLGIGTLEFDLGTPHYPIYHATLTSDGSYIIASYYNGQVACWSLDGKLRWRFECKNKVKPGLSVTENNLVSALCENGKFFLIKDGKQIFETFINVDFRKNNLVIATDKLSILSDTNKLFFFDENGKTGELEFKDDIRDIAYERQEKLLGIAATDISIIKLPT